MKGGVQSGAVCVGQFHVSVQQLEVVAPGGVHCAVSLHADTVSAEDHNQDEDDGQVSGYLEITQDVGH